MVLHVRIVTGTGGGADKTVLNSLRFLTSHGYDSICVFMRAPGDSGFDAIRKRAKELDAALIEIDDRGPFDLSVFFKLLRICRQYRVTIWHAHEYKSNVLGLVLRPFWPMRLLTTVHGWGVHGGRTKLYYAIDRISLRFYERVVCVSRDLSERCRDSGVAESRCRLIHNAIDIEQFKRSSSQYEAKRRLGIATERLVVGSVGRLSSEKAFDLLIRCVDELAIRGVDLELLIVGEGEEAPKLEELVARIRSKGRVRLLGFRADTVSIYEAMDVYVLSSRREGLPNVLLEALALEVPVVATRVGGVPQLIKDGESGMLVEIDDQIGMTKAIEKLLADPLLRRRLARSGLAVIEAGYSFRRRIERMAALYDEVLGRRRD